jgi:hypothetical protein
MRTSLLDARTPASKGRILRAFGIAAFVTGTVLGFALRFVDLPLTPLYFSPVILILVGASMLYHGKLLAAAEQSVAASALAPETPPVVYLRPFAVDESGWGQIFSALLTAKMFTPVLSEEEQLARAVAPIGPLIAIGQPGESLPTPGAARIYPAHWRESVEDLLRRARLVILRPGTSEGVRWEVEHSFRTVDPAKVVLMFERVKAKDYEKNRTAIADACSVQLPPFKEVRRGRRARAFLEFEPNWTPKVLPLKAPYWRTGRTAMVHIFKYSLRPVFQRFGVPFQPSPVSAGRVIGAAVGAAVGGLLMISLFAFVLDAIVKSSHVTGRDTTQFTPAISPKVPGEAARSVHAEPQRIAGLEIAIGGNPQLVGLPIKAEVAEMFDSLVSYDLRDGRLELQVLRADIKPGIAVSLDGTAKLALEGMAAGVTADGATDFHSSTAESTVLGHRAIRTSASFKITGEPWIARGVIFGVGQTTWSVLALVSQKHDFGAADRVINSVTLAPTDD